MTYGYSQSLVYANKKASTKSLGVVLGRVCIRANLGVNKVADDLGVTRMTVYNWFKGDSVPFRSYDKKISDYILQIKTHHRLK